MGTYHFAALINTCFVVRGVSVLNAFGLPPKLALLLSILATPPALLLASWTQLMKWVPSWFERLNAWLKRRRGVITNRRQSRRYQEALTAAERATTLAPTDAVAWDRKAQVLADLGRYEEALGAAEQATSLAPDYALARERKAQLLKDFGPKAEAEEVKAGARLAPPG
jgi:tetratricopeptide (TPR) repeat protein